MQHTHPQQSSNVPSNNSTVCDAWTTTAHPIQPTSHPHSSPTHHTALVLYLVVVQTIGAVAGGIRAWLFESASVRVMCRLRQRVFESVCWQEIGFYDRVRIGELTNRLGEVWWCACWVGGGACSMFGCVLFFFWLLRACKMCFGTRVCTTMHLHI